MRCVGHPEISVAANDIRPRCSASSPMIAFRVVDLPAPLRPSSTTASPASTDTAMACRT